MLVVLLTEIVGHNAIIVLKSLTIEAYVNFKKILFESRIQNNTNSRAINELESVFCMFCQMAYVMIQ